MATIPMFDGDNYDFWCVKMKTLFLSMDLSDIVENGYNEPKVKPAMTESEKIQLKKNQQEDAAALSKIQQGVSDSIFPKIMKATKAKEAWDILRQEFQGDAQDQNLNEAKEDQPTQQCHSDHMDSELYKAAVKGNLEILRENKGQLNLQLTPNKNTVLHIAALFGKTECVKEILKMNSSLLCQTNVKGDTALHLAAREGQQYSVDTLIKRAKQLDVEGSVELESGSTMTKKMLTARNEDGDTALHDAVRLYSHGITLDRLLTEDPDTYTANNAGETPLYIAAERRHYQVVSQILETCEAAAYDGPGGRTALHAAVISNDEKSTKTLLDWNKDLAKKPDMYGWTPLHYAARFGYVERAKQLLDVDKSIAYVIADKDDKKTALYVAASQGNVGVMKELLSQCPDCWETVNDKGQNILHVAVQNENKKVVKFILENSQLSSLINHKDIDGNTPLHLTVTTFCANKLIYDKRADRMAFNKRNQTPLDVTTHHENVTFVTQVLKRTKSKKRGYSPGWRNIISDDNENLTKKMKANDNKHKRITPTSIMKIMKTQLIVAALIATVTFAAGFTIPGGYDGNQGPNQGMATLTREAAFKAFAVTNTIAMILSTSAILIDFWGVLISDRDKLLKHYNFASKLISIAIIAMVLAFITGTYAILEHSRALAIAVCITSCLFFWIFYNLFKEILNKAIERSSL